MPRPRTRHMHPVGPLTLALSHEGRGEAYAGALPKKLPFDGEGRRLMTGHTHSRQNSAPPLPLWERAGVRGKDA